MLKGQHVAFLFHTRDTDGVVVDRIEELVGVWTNHFDVSLLVDQRSQSVAARGVGVGRSGTHSSVEYVRRSARSMQVNHLHIYPVLSELSSAVTRLGYLVIH